MLQVKCLLDKSLKGLSLVRIGGLWEAKFEGLTVAFGQKSAGECLASIK